MSAGGSFASLTFESQDSYADWPNSVCASSPYLYLRPFSFTSSAGSSPSYCGFPSSNSDFRFIISSIAVVHVILLYFKTPLSLLARPALAMYGFLFFTACVMDSFAISTGQAVCDNNFANTSLSGDIQSKGLTLTCTLSNYSGVAVVDLGIAAIFLILHTAWGLTADLYVKKGALSYLIKSAAKASDSSNSQDVTLSATSATTSSAPKFNYRSNFQSPVLCNSFINQGNFYKANIASTIPSPSKPTSIPTLKPKSIPSPKSTSIPSLKPTSSKPTSKPTSIRSKPTSIPSLKPTSLKPTSIPSLKPTSSKPTSTPTSIRSLKPKSSKPTSIPSSKPTLKQTSSPTMVPTSSLTQTPIVNKQSSSKASPTPPLTRTPTKMPYSYIQQGSGQSRNPTPTSPTNPNYYKQQGSGNTNQSPTPTAAPVNIRTQRPSYSFIISPIHPESVRRVNPTRAPTGPSRSPTFYPSNPTARPSAKPSNPTSEPTAEPTYYPTEEPTESNQGNKKKT
eukprot:gene29011-38055_t